MKRINLYIIFYLFSSISSSLLAQNYRTLPLNVKEHYYKDSLGYVFPIEPDSVKFINGDTVYFHFKSIRQIPTTATGYYNQLYNLNGDSWAGKKTIIKSNGDNIWFANQRDSILIKPKAKINEAWLVSGKYQLYGTVVGISIQTFCGISDSVKTLKIGKYKFELSKNYGLIEMPDIFHFYSTVVGTNYIYKYPYTGPISNVKVYGSNIIPRSKTKLTDSLVYNFEVGDEFHIQETLDYYNPYIFKSIHTIKGKSYNATNLTISYIEDICSLSIVGRTLGPPSNTYNVYSSKSDKKEVNSIFNLNTPQVTPLKIDLVNGYLTFPNLKFNAEGLLELRSSINYLKMKDSIGTFNVVQEFFKTTTKIEKRGSFFDKDGQDGSHEIKLIFTKSSDKISNGIPFVCDSLLNYKTGIDDELNQSKISIISPFDENLIFTSTQSIKSVKLIDLQGNVKLEETLFEPKLPQYSIPTTHLNAGLYLLLITDINGNQFSTKVVKL